MSKYAGVIVRANNKCMLCKRAPYHSFLPNVWSFPSGHVEEGEEDIESAKREFYEETGLKAKNLKYVSKMESRNGKGDVAIYLMDIDEQIVPDLELAQDGYEHTVCKYFSKKTLPETTPELEKILDILLK
jgi:8-oxo-dGTP pyrophosphatase MutT (NUDIX family)